MKLDKKDKESIKASLDGLSDDYYQVSLKEWSNLVTNILKVYPSLKNSKTFNKLFDSYKPVKDYGEKIKKLESSVEALDEILVKNGL